MRPLFLVGFMGAGKTTVGRLVAGRLGRPFFDLDREIEVEEGRSVDELFALGGEKGFRDAERAALRRVSVGPEAVVACGGGVVTDEASRAQLCASGDVVYLSVSPAEALARVGDETAGRPLLRGTGIDAVTLLMSSRERLYDSVAGCTISTIGHTPEEVADRVVAWVGSRT
jgi:shikimate kinase